ncbi:hypothetical protein F4802DRAFT_187572 [Xylaria palmicola]|nr:hypothetical protein F4802DRAFT_187572 [Xylaria palmicola]
MHLTEQWDIHLRNARCRAIPEACPARARRGARHGQADPNAARSLQIERQCDRRRATHSRSCATRGKCSWDAVDRRRWQGHESSASPTPVSVATLLSVRYPVQSSRPGAGDGGRMGTTTTYQPQYGRRACCSVADMAQCRHCDGEHLPLNRLAPSALVRRRAMLCVSMALCCSTWRGQPASLSCLNAQVVLGRLAINGRVFPSAMMS